MKVRRVLLAILIGFVFLSLYEWLFHGILLKSTYQLTPQLWRDPEEMKQHLAYLIGGRFLMTLFLVIIFAKGYENRGIGEGIRYGMLLGFLFAATHVMWYGIQAIPPVLLLSWVLGSIVEMIGLGVVLALICRPKT